MSNLTLADMASRTMASKRKNWIKSAVPKEHRGVFKAKAERAGKSTAEFAKEHAGDSGKTGTQARLAETLMGMHKRKSKMYSHPSSSKE